MSFLGLDINLFDTLIIVNVLSVFFTAITVIQTLRGMKQEAKQEFALQLREQQRRKHEYSQSQTLQQQQHCGENESLVLNLDKRGLPIVNKNEEFLDGNDIVVLSKKVRQSTAQKISQNIGET